MKDFPCLFMVNRKYRLPLCAIALSSVVVLSGCGGGTSIKQGPEAGSYQQGSPGWPHRIRFQPQLVLINEVRESNAQLYDYRRTRSELRFVRQL